MYCPSLTPGHLPPLSDVNDMLCTLIRLWIRNISEKSLTGVFCKNELILQFAAKKIEPHCPDDLRMIIRRFHLALNSSSPSACSQLGRQALRQPNGNLVFNSTALLFNCCLSSERLPVIIFRWNSHNCFPLEFLVIFQYTSVGCR